MVRTRNPDTSRGAPPATGLRLLPPLSGGLRLRIERAHWREEESSGVPAGRPARQHPLRQGRWLGWMVVGSRAAGSTFALARSSGAHAPTANSATHARAHRRSAHAHDRSQRAGVARTHSTSGPARSLSRERTKADCADLLGEIHLKGKRLKCALSIMNHWKYMMHIF